ncbi:unnamed protein product [Schistocephalus solidus]|uniref:Uncharacterized protein n=1 Tax=Schistocephalus solidus TaxID=70667 RepID=A0A183SZK7_SCHSO|nr:unnamed protein product [Schistocephalus solidus]
MFLTRFRDAACELELGASDHLANPETGNSASSSPSTIPASVSPPDENTKPAASSILTATSSPSSPNSALRKGIRRRHRRLTETTVPPKRHTITRRRTALARRTPLSEMQPTLNVERMPTVGEVCPLDTESEGDATPVAAASTEATLSASPSILSVLKYPSPVSPTPTAKPPRRRRNTVVIAARGGSRRQVYQRVPSLRKFTDNGLKQTSISAYFASATKTRIMDVTNELFKSLLTTDGRQTERYSLRSSDTGASSQASSLCLGRSRPPSQQTL